MSFMERVRAGLKAAFTDPADPVIRSMMAGIFPGAVAEPPKRGTTEFLKAYSTMPWLRAVTSKVAFAVASLEWQLFIARNARGQAVRNQKIQLCRQPGQRRKQIKQAVDRGELEEITSHPLLDALASGNGGTVSGMALFKTTQTWLDLDGNGFWLKERSNVRLTGQQRGMPVAFWPVPPDWVHGFPTQSNPFFHIAHRSFKEDVPLTEMAWFSDTNPLNPYGRGSGVAEALADELDTDEFAAKHTKLWFFNRARPDLIVSAEGLQQHETERLEQDWVQKHGGFWRAFKPFFLNRKVDVKEVGQTFQEMQMVDLRRFERDMIVQTYGFPPELLGILTSSNRATIDAADYLFDKYATIPRAELLRSCMQVQIVPDYDDRLILDYVSPLSDDPDFVLNVATRFPWVMNVDAQRRLAGQDPIGGAVGEGFIMRRGFQFVGNLEQLTEEIAGNDETGPGAGGVGGEQDAGDQDDPTGEAAAGASDGQIKRPSVGFAAGAETKQNRPSEWLALHEVADRFTARLQASVVDGILSVREKIDLERLLSEITERDVAAVLRLVDFSVLEREWKGRWQQTFLEVLGAGALVAQDFLPEVAVGVRFNLQAPAAASWASANAAKLVTDIADREAIRQQVTDWFGSGQAQTDFDLQLRIRGVIGLNGPQRRSFDKRVDEMLEAGLAGEKLERAVLRLSKGMIAQRARTIARTEAINAATRGQFEMWNQVVAQTGLTADDVRKVWLVTPDDLLDREICEPMDGQQRRLNEFFETGTGDAVFLPTAHPNCRCAVVYRVVS